MSNELIEKIIMQNDKLIKQNDEIIDLLKILTKSGDGEIIENKCDSIFENDLNPGEVLTTSCSCDGEINIKKISIKKSDDLKVKPVELEKSIRSYLDGFDDINFEIRVDNLIGDDLNMHFNVPFFVALESLDKNIPVNTGVSILNDENFDNLPEILRVSMENGADKIYLPLKSAMSIVHAPQELMNHLVFYKTLDDIFSKLF